MTPDNERLIENLTAVAIQYGSVLESSPHKHTAAAVGARRAFEEARAALAQRIEEMEGFQYPC